MIEATWGPFKPYVPTDEVFKPLVDMGALFACTEKGEDWYDLTHKLTPRPVYALCLDGKVISVSRDPTSFGIHDGMVLISTSPDVAIGWGYDGKTVFPPKPPAPPTLEEAKALAKHKINALADQKRRSFATPGMDAVYREKIEQAEHVLAEGKDVVDQLSLDQAVGQFPLLAASIGSEVETVWQAAELVVASHRTWAQRVGRIETRRLLALKALDQAGTLDAVAAVVAAVTFDGL